MATVRLRRFRVSCRYWVTLLEKVHHTNIAGRSRQPNKIDKNPNQEVTKPTIDRQRRYLTVEWIDIYFHPYSEKSLKLRLFWTSWNLPLNELAHKLKKLESKQNWKWLAVERFMKMRNVSPFLANLRGDWYTTLGYACSELTLNTNFRPQKEGHSTEHNGEVLWPNWVSW